MSQQPPTNPSQQPTYQTPQPTFTQYPSFPPPPPQPYQPRPPYPQQMMPPPPMYAPNITVLQNKRQLPFLVRALYFCFLGCWLGILWASVALLLICTIIGAPIGLLMLNSLPAVLTLYQK